MSAPVAAPTGWERPAGVLMMALTAVALLFGVYATAVARPRAAASDARIAAREPSSTARGAADLACNTAASAAPRGSAVKIAGRIRTLAGGTLDLEARGLKVRARFVDVPLDAVETGDDVEIEALVRDRGADGSLDVIGLAVTRV